MVLKVCVVWCLDLPAPPIANSFQGEYRLLELAFELQDRIPQAPGETMAVRWFQFVLFPELLNLLIMQDLRIPYENANEWRMKSRE